MNTPNLISCPACHRQVSDAAANCPGCGQPIKRGFRAAFSEAVAQTRIQMNQPEEIARRKRTQRIVLVCSAVFFVLLLWLMLATQQTPEERERDWQKTLKETQDYGDRKAKEKEEQWKAKNREEAARWIRNHPNGR